MALSGSFSGSVFNGHHQVRVDWTATQNVANNTSTITAKLYYVHDWSISISARSSAHSVTIDGTTTTFSSSAIKQDSGEHLIGTATKTISHNSDGTKSISMSASFALRATLNGTYYGNITASATITLDTIARASQPSVSASSVDMGEAVTITTNRASSNFTHTLEYAFAGNTGAIATGVGASYAWTVPLSLANYLTDYVGSTLTITCKTYNGSTLIGTKTVSIVVSVPSSVVPTISAITCTDLYGYADTYGAYIQGKSKLNVAVTAAGAYSSTIKSYKIEANQTSYNYNNCTTDVLRRYGSQTVTVTVTDSRGRTATGTATITVLAYTSPSISTLTAYRCLSDGTEDEAGAYMKVTIGASITSLNSKNAKTFSLLYKTKSATSYTTSKTWSSAYTLSTSVIIAASADYSYDIKVQAIDSFGTVEASTAIGTSFTLMDFRNTGEGIAFGKASERDAFECNIPAIFMSCTTETGADLDVVAAEVDKIKFANYATGNTWTDNYTLLISLDPSYYNALQYWNRSLQPKRMSVSICSNNKMTFIYDLMRSPLGITARDYDVITKNHYSALSSAPSATFTIVYDADSDLYNLKCVFATQILNTYSITSTTSYVY